MKKWLLPLVLALCIVVPSDAWAGSPIKIKGVDPTNHSQKQEKEVFWVWVIGAAVLLAVVVTYSYWGPYIFGGGNDGGGGGDPFLPPSGDPYGDGVKNGSKTRNPLIRL